MYEGLDQLFETLRYFAISMCRSICVNRKNGLIFNLTKEQIREDLGTSQRANHKTNDTNKTEENKLWPGKWKKTTDPV